MKNSHLICTDYNLSNRSSLDPSNWKVLLYALCCTKEEGHHNLTCRSNTYSAYPLGTLSDFLKNNSKLIELATTPTSNYLLPGSTLNKCAVRNWKNSKILCVLKYLWASLMASVTFGRSFCDSFTYSGISHSSKDASSSIETPTIPIRYSTLFLAADSREAEEDVIADSDDSVWDCINHEKASKSKALKERYVQKI